MTTAKTLKGLSVEGRLELLSIVRRMGTADRKQILEAMGKDYEMLSPDWQKVKRDTAWLVSQSFLTVVETNKKIYSFNEVRWTLFIQSLARLV